MGSQAALDSGPRRQVVGFRATGCTFSKAWTSEAAPPDMATPEAAAPGAAAPGRPDEPSEGLACGGAGLEEDGGGLGGEFGVVAPRFREGAGVGFGGGGGGGVETAIYSVPYSRHSTNKELNAFVAVELELELIQYQMTQKPMLRCEVGARSLRASSHA